VELDVVVGVERERGWRSPRLLGGLIVVKRKMKYEEVTRRRAGCYGILYPRRDSGDVGRWSWWCGFLGASFYRAS
jgi:hypothetical protein